MENSLTHGVTFSQLSKPIGDAFKESCSREPLKTLQLLLGTNRDLFLVGGAVRDLLSGKEFKDIDLATPLHPEEVSEILKSAGIRVIETGILHGTLTAIVDDHSVEITTFRKPGPRNSGLFSASIKEDLSGRDFTINAIAVRLEDGVIADPFDGYADLTAGLVRAVGNATERFEEDPLRLMRMVRFGPAWGHTVEPQTLAAACKSSALISKITPERIRDELNQILLGPVASEGIRALQETGILTKILPEIKSSIGFEQNDFHIHDVFEHTLWVLERSAHDLPLRLACLFHDLGKPGTLSVDKDNNRHFYSHEYAGEEIAKRAMTRLCYGKKLQKQVALLVRYHMRPLDCGPAGVRRLLRDLGDDFDSWLLLKQADKPPVMSDQEFKVMYDNFMQMVQTELEKSQNKSPKLAITGDDLIELGYSPGPEMGRMLRDLEELIIEDPDKNQVEQLVNHIKKTTPFPDKGGLE